MHNIHSTDYHFLTSQYPCFLPPFRSSFLILSFDSFNKISISSLLSLKLISFFTTTNMSMSLNSELKHHIANDPWRYIPTRFVFKMLTAYASYNLFLKQIYRLKFSRFLYFLSIAYNWYNCICKKSI